MHSSSPVGEITDIVKKLNSGASFYADAISHVASENYQAMFTRMQEEKVRAINTLQPLSNLDKDNAKAGRNGCIELRHLYTSILATIASDHDYTYMKQLIEVEESILHAIDKALDVGPPPEQASTLRLVRTRMQQCHDEMLSLHSAAVSQIA